MPVRLDDFFVLSREYPISKPIILPSRFIHVDSSAFSERGCNSWCIPNLDDTNAYILRILYGLEAWAQQIKLVFDNAKFRVETNQASK